MNMKQEIILIGGGGHCKSVIDVIETEDKFKIVGVVDLPEKLGQRILNYKIIANDNEIKDLIKKFKYFLITVGYLKTPTLRIKLFNIVKKNQGEFPVIISQNAYVSEYAKIGEGTVIMHHAIVNTDSKIGKNCIINNKALIEHDCKIGNNCHISTNTIINGGVVVNDNCFIGSSSVTKQYLKIASNTIIGAGSVVTKNITESGVYVGCPARKIK